MQKRLLPLIALLLAPTACALPRWPAAGVITSPYGLRLDGWRPELHHGVDIAMPSGTPVHAMAEGRVLFAGVKSGYGTVVILDHGNVTTLYAHLSQARVEPNARVARGFVIGLSGASGNVSGPHLHFEILRAGRPEDPVLLLGGLPPRR